MDLIQELRHFGRFADTDDEERFIEVMQGMVSDPKPEYIDAMLGFLNDDAPLSDLHKTIVGMVECCPKAMYCASLLRSLETLRQKAPDWLDYILYRITNSPEDDKIFMGVAAELKDRSAIERCLSEFAAKHPEKRIAHPLLNRSP